MVIKVRRQGQMSSSLQLMIEDYFFAKFPKLRRIKLRQFKKASSVAAYMHMSERRLRDMCAMSDTLHGIIDMEGELLLHPDPLFKEIGKAGQKFLKRLCAGKHNLLLR